MSVHPLPPTQTTVADATRIATQTNPASTAETISFADTIEKLIETVNQDQVAAADKAQQMARGDVSIDEAMITMERADLQFRLLTQVRNKVVDAYREVMRMNF